MKAKPLQTKIIAGKYKGAKLDLPSLLSTRSSKSILKESLFNTIAYDLYDADFVEVFAGSGSVMLEALSRGAKKVYGIEIDKAAYKILTQNASRLDESKCKCLRGDSFELLASLVEQLENPTFIFFDPPFEFRDNMENIYQKCFSLLKTLDASRIEMAIFEHMSSLKMPQDIGEFSLHKTKKFGKSSLSYFQKAENGKRRLEDNLE